MSLTKEFFDRETNITAKVICDSINEAGDRITTLEIEYPRFILAEVNTHKALEKNSSSSRAIPIKDMIKQVGDNMGQPISWGAAKSGMQAGEELEAWGDFGLGWVTWLRAMENAEQSATEFAKMGYHKQIANRLLEPFQVMKTVITGTDWDNFFNLRIHPDAQPEFCMLAYKIYKAMEASKPYLLTQGQWHLPYVDSSWPMDKDDNINYAEILYHVGEIGTEQFKWLTLEEAQRISASCCAQTSYRKSDDSLEKADKVFDLLMKADVLHASPFGHLATPVNESFIGGSSEKSIKDNLNESVNLKNWPETWEDGITHMRRDGKYCSGNLSGWISYRHLIPNNTCYKFNFDKRMELFK